MDNSINDLRDLFADPRESLGVELKQWIDPTSPEGNAKIAKACIALRNNNGGRLVIGFKDDASPDVGNAPTDVQGTFHADVIQAIVSRYSAEQFAVEVQFVEMGGQVYPVISVPPGVRTPVAAKATLFGADGKVLIRDHAVYVRSLRSNNTVSSTEARRGDWDSLTRICFDNREADIGGFVRRHLAALDLDALAQLIPALAGSANRTTMQERVAEELDRGRSRFEAAIQGREPNLPNLGFSESLIIIEGEFPRQSGIKSFRRNLLNRTPRHTGWPPWDDRQNEPYVLDQGWEALLNLDVQGPFGSPHLDFWRMEPQGVFYYIYALRDDLERGPVPGTQLDFLLQISRIAEVISTGLSFGRSLGCDETTTSLVFGFRWSGLIGRLLTSWVEPMRRLRTHAPSNQDEIMTVVTVPLETPPDGIPPHVENAVRDLFALFGGMEIDSRVIEDIVMRLLRQRV